MNDDSQFTRQEGIALDGRRVRLLLAPPTCSCPPVGDDSPLRLPILFLHGLGCTGDVWLPTIKEMAARGLACPMVAPDLPGYGHSVGPDHALGMVALADWTVRLLEARELERVHIAGNSMGCQVALALARRHPEKVGALVLQGPTTGTRHVPPWRYMTGLAADAAHESLSYNWSLLQMYGKMGLKRYLETSQKMMQDDPWESIAEVRAPTLVIRGGHDAIVSDKTARRLAAALPDGVYYPLDSAAHAIEFNNPAEFTDAMMGFLLRSEERLLGPKEPPQPETTARTKSQTTAAPVAATTTTK